MTANVGKSDNANKYFDLVVANKGESWAQAKLERQPRKYGDSIKMLERIAIAANAVQNSDRTDKQQFLEDLTKAAQEIKERSEAKTKPINDLSRKIFGIAKREERIKSLVAQIESGKFNDLIQAQKLGYKGNDLVEAKRFLKNLRSELKTAINEKFIPKKYIAYKKSGLFTMVDQEQTLKNLKNINSNKKFEILEKIWSYSTGERERSRFDGGSLSQFLSAIPARGQPPTDEVLETVASKLKKAAMGYYGVHSRSALGLAATRTLINLDFETVNEDLLKKMKDVYGYKEPEALLKAYYAERNKRKVAT